MLRVHNRMSTAEHLATKFGSPQSLPQCGLRNVAFVPDSNGSQVSC